MLEILDICWIYLDMCLLYFLYILGNMFGIFQYFFAIGAYFGCHSWRKVAAVAAQGQAAKHQAALTLSESAMPS